MKFCRTIHQLNTLFKNPDTTETTEIEVTDPRHPLFGRRFPLISMHSSPHGSIQVLVGYREALVLRIPLAATTLASTQPSVLTKLTCEAVEELVLLAGECETVCLPIPPPSGGSCLQTSNTPSSTIFQEVLNDHIRTGDAAASSEEGAHLHPAIDAPLTHLQSGESPLAIRAAGACAKPGMAR